MKCNKWIVKEEDVRPARPDGTCFYCCSALGDQHRQGCVLRTKTVVMDATFRVVFDVPEDWDRALIEFRYNESTWCAGNLVDTLVKMHEEGDCMCDRTRVKYVRQATLEDHRRYTVCDYNEKWEDLLGG